MGFQETMKNKYSSGFLGELVMVVLSFGSGFLRLEKMEAYFVGLGKRLFEFWVLSWVITSFKWIFGIILKNANGICWLSRGLLRTNTKGIS